MAIPYTQETISRFYDILLQEYTALENGSLFEELFEKIEIKSETIPYDHSESFKYQHLNRYPDIHTHKDTAYVSKTVPYISANQIDERYIFTQGPKFDTICDFWDMVFHTSNVVVSVSGLVEDEKIKYDPYFEDIKTAGRSLLTSTIDCDISQMETHQFVPVSVEKIYSKCFGTYKFGSQVISHTKELGIDVRQIIVNKYEIIKEIRTVPVRRSRFAKPSSTTETTQTTVLVDKLVSSKTITHIHYDSWSDHCAPADFANIYKIIELMDANARGAPVIIHCSAGVGRTGTLGVIKDIFDEIKKIQTNGIFDPMYKIDIPETILRLRHYRNKLVQTPTQLKFCYAIILDFLQKLL